MSVLTPLNPEQREAAMHTDGPLLILAGAGSGKTRVIVTRIAHLILEKGVPPEAILGVTFTNKAADEMRERVERLLDGSGTAGGVTLSTFHSFCVRVLRRHGARLAESRAGFTPGFLIFDAADQVAVVKDAIRSDGTVSDAFKPKAVLGAISRFKSNESANLSLAGLDTAGEQALRRIYDRYESALVAANALDFDDLLLEAARLLRTSSAVREALQDRYRYLLVDEFQDTNRCQYEIVRLLAGLRRNVCVVGDEDQTIYSWRGAEIGNILGFEQDFPAARVVRLEQNYRSTQRILEAASALIARNTQSKGKQLWTEGPRGEKPVLFRATDSDAEARYVAREIGELLDGDPAMRAAVLYRTNAQSRLLEEALRRAGRDFLLVGSVAFYQRAEVKDLLAYLKAAVSRDDAVSLRRIINVPARGIGNSTLARLQEHAAGHNVSLWTALEQSLDGRLLPGRALAALEKFRNLMTQLRALAERETVSEVLAWVIEKTEYRDSLESDRSKDSQSRVENVDELLAAAREASDRGDSLVDFLDHTALVSDTDSIDQASRILLMTIHNAKGLEFPAVALVGLEEGLLPHVRSMESGDAATEEERRLCYVGMTRARSRLLMTCAGERRQFGGGWSEKMRPSRFLQDIPRKLLDDRTPRRHGLARTDSFAEPVRAGAGRPTAPAAGVRANPAAGVIETHDSVAAVAGFFKHRGIDMEAPAGSRRLGAAPPAAMRPPSGGPQLGKALKTLRSQGPFARGARVRHQRFGVGVVQRREGEGPNAKLSVYFRKHGMKKLVAQYAGLQEL